MNTPLFYLRYFMTGTTAFLIGKEIGPGVGVVVFIVANVIWTIAEELSSIRRNKKQTQRWQQRNKEI